MKLFNQEIVSDVYLPIMDIISSLSTIEKVEGKAGADLAKEIIAASMDKI